MGYVSGPKLVTAVSNAGGLGILASATMSLAELRSAIKETAAGTNGPFGVNIRADAPDAGERVAAVIGAGVPIASFALAPKPELIAALKDAGVVTIASVGARRHAEKVAAWGVDAVIATGGEGGGHTGAVPTSLLIPQVVDAVDIPVIAAGGFFDGRGLVAALGYGAAGIAMGTRFLLTTDSPVADAVKRVYLAAGLDGTVVTRRVDGVPHRVLRTPLVDRLEGGGRAGTLLRSARNAVRFRELSGPVVARAAAVGARDAPRRRAVVGAGADGGEHADAAAGGDGRRAARPRADVVRAGGGADRGPAVVRGADRPGDGRGRGAAGRACGRSGMTTPVDVAPGARPIMSSMTEAAPETGTRRPARR